MCSPSFTNSYKLWEGPSYYWKLETIHLLNNEE